MMNTAPTKEKTPTGATVRAFEAKQLNHAANEKELGMENSLHSSASQDGAGVSAAIHVSIGTAMDALDASTLAQESFTKLFNLLEAIRMGAHGNPEMVYSLADVGMEMIDNWSQLHAGKVDQVRQGRAKLEALLAAA